MVGIKEADAKKENILVKITEKLLTFACNQFFLFPLPLYFSPAKQFYFWVNNLIGEFLGHLDPQITLT